MLNSSKSEVKMRRARERKEQIEQDKHKKKIFLMYRQEFLREAREKSYKELMERLKRQ